MKCIVHLSGKTKASVEIEYSHDMFNENYPENLYTAICNIFQDNDWKDICCERIDYENNSVICYVAVE